MRRTFTLLTVSTLAAAALSACGSDGGSGSGSGEIKVAVVAPFTGGLAYLGGSLRQPVQDYFDEVNASGFEIDGKKIELTAIEGDDQGTPDVGVDTVKKLQTKEGVEYFLGPMSSGVASAIEPLMASKADSTWIMSSAAVLGPTDNPNVFRNASLMRVYNDGVISYVKANPDFKRVALVTDETHTAVTQTTDDFTADLKSAGIDIVASETVSIGDTDFRAMLTKFKGLEPDLVIYRGYAAEAAQVTEQSKELGGNWANAWTTKISDGDMQKLAKSDALKGAVTCYDPGLEDEAKAGDADAAAQLKAFGSDYSNLSDKAYDSAVILVAAMRKADSTDPKKVNAALEELTVADVSDDVLGTYEPQDGGLLFKDHEVDIKSICSEWDGQQWKQIPGV